MPNPYLYVVIALAVVLVVIGAYLGMMVSNEAAKAAVLQNQLNALKTNYTTLRTQYTQLQNQYNQLQTQYNELESNYTGLIGNITSFEDIVPILYVTPSSQVNYTMLILNITNPTNQYMNISLDVYTAMQHWPYFYNELMWPPNYVEIPPHTTLPVPVILAMVNKTAVYVPGQLWMYGYIDDMFMQKYLITVYTNKLSNLGLAGIVSSHLVVVVQANEPFGYATYSPNDTSIDVSIANPLSTQVLIYGYDVFAYNGTLLATCKIYEPFTKSTMPIPINATSIMNVNLSVESVTMDTEPLNGCSISNSSLITCSVDEFFVTYSLSCTPYYVFPTSPAQMPYGYVVLHTNIGDITIPLVPSPWASW